MNSNPVDRDMKANITTKTGSSNNKNLRNSAVDFYDSSDDYKQLINMRGLKVFKELKLHFNIDDGQPNEEKINAKE